MTLRRSVLFFGVLTIGASFPEKVGARGPVQIEAAGYSGSETAHFTACDAGSATMGVKYGGLGARATFLPPTRTRADGSGTDEPILAANPSPSSSTADAFAPPLGFSGSLAIAGEHVDAQLTCTGDCAGFQRSYFPLTWFRGGGEARFGYDWKYIGLQGGLVLSQGIGKSGVGEFPSAGLPDISMRFGTRELAWGEFGVGAYNLPTILRPGAYVGAGICPAPKWSIVFHYGAHVPAGTGEAVGRADLEARGPMFDRFQVGAGFAISSGGRESQLPEGRFIAAAEF